MHAESETRNLSLLQTGDQARRGGRSDERIALVVEDNPSWRRALVDSLRHPRLRVLESSSIQNALSVLRGQAVDVVFASHRLHDRSGIELLESVRSRWPNTRRALVAENIDLPEMCDAINRAGVSFLLPKPIESTVVERIRCEVLERAPLLPSRTDCGDGASYGIIGKSPAIRALIDLIEKIARTESTVLVTGETGTGKELVGHAIHQASHRAKGIFSAINSAAVPETLLESELFGHRRGAFTGATTNRRGLFEYTDGGTVFLDELGEMPLPMQAKLLRFLQTGEVRPVGGETSRIVDVRLVSATNKDLDAEVEAGRFREDLYYRLAVILIPVPPLRDRVEDIPLLVDSFLRSRTGNEERPIAEIESDAMEVLTRHSWPGNVRELQNVVERGVALCSGDRIRVSDLPTRLLARRGSDATDGIQSLPGMERRHILETLDKVGWNRKNAASLLQISTTTLWRRLKEFGIDEGRTRASNGSRVSANG